MTDAEKDAYQDGFLAGIADERQRLIKALKYGCGDNSCMIHKPIGMGTNGGCRCFKVMSFQDRQDLAGALRALCNEGDLARQVARKWEARLELLRSAVTQAELSVDSLSDRAYRNGLQRALFLLSRESL